MSETKTCANCNPGYGKLFAYNQGIPGTVSAPINMNMIVPSYGGFAYDLSGFNSQITGSGYYNLNSAYPAYSSVCQRGYTKLCNP